MVVVLVFIVGCVVVGSLISGSVTTIFFSVTTSGLSHNDSVLISITGLKISSTSSLSNPKDFAVS